MLEPTELNTLELLINKSEFADIRVGKLTEVVEEINNKSYTKLLDVDGDGLPYYNDELLSKDFDPEANAAGDLLVGIIHAWNEGIYPLVPNQNIAFVHLYEDGGERERGELILPVMEIYFRPVRNKKNNPIRFRVNETDDWINDENGELCLWEMVLCLGKK